MAKYRKKTIILDAVLYQPGMEDGFLMKGDYGVEPAPKEDYENQDWDGYKIIGPFIWTNEGYDCVNEGDYIITYANGEKGRLPDFIFEHLYELVEEY